MLDAIKQLAPIQLTQPTAIGRQPGQDEGEPVFDQLFGQTGPAQGPPSRPVGDDEDRRPELSSGWDTADAHLAEAANEPSAAVAAGQAPSQPAESSPEEQSPSAPQPNVEPAQDQPVGQTEAETQARAGQVGSGQLQEMSLLEALRPSPVQSQATQGDGEEIAEPSPQVAGQAARGTSADISAALAQSVETVESKTERDSRSGAFPGERRAGSQQARPTGQGTDQGPAQATEDLPEGVEVFGSSRQPTDQGLLTPADPSTERPADAGGVQAQAPEPMLADAAGMQLEEGLAAPRLDRADPASGRPPVPTSGAPMAQAPAGQPQLDVEQLAARAVRWQQLGMLDRGGSARIRLSPPELGSVRIALQASDNAVRIHMTVETESVRQLLSSNSERLTESLQVHGMQARRIEVTVQTLADQQAEQGRSQDGQGRQPPDEQQPRRQGGQQQAFADDMQDELNLTA